MISTAVAKSLMAAFLLSLFVLPPSLMQADRLAGSEPRIYKSVGSVKLSLHIFRPAGHNPSDKLAAVVFFFGGGWRQGSVTQFASHSRYLAERGMVAIVADYRVKSRHGVTPIECIADAKSAIRWVRSHASELGIDQNRIAAGGGSAGGHLAAATATVNQFDETSEDQTISSKPNALILFNPALDIANIPAGYGFGDKAAAASPINHLHEGLPPTIVFHGTADRTVPFEQATRFCEGMKNLKNRCEVISYEGRGHGFFNLGRGDGNDYKTTLRKTDQFLTSLGYLHGESRVE